MRKILSICTLLAGFIAQAQQLKATVVVNAEEVGMTNTQIFKNLETSVTEFINRTDWAGSSKADYTINTAFYLNITQYNDGRFSGTLQVQAARSVFDSNYSSPTLNFNDKDFAFEYQEFQAMNFNPNSFDSNLISVLAFYCNFILGLDADSYVEKGGAKYFSTAQEIVNVAQSSNYKGWKQADGLQNRYFLVTDLLSATFEKFRKGWYEYHFEGLDQMAENTDAGKLGITNALNSLMEVHSVRPNSFVMRTFFDAKADEIVTIYNGGPKVTDADLLNKLSRLSPINSNKWSRIRL